MVELLTLDVDPATSAAKMEKDGVGVEVEISFSKASKISKSQKEMQLLKEQPINCTNSDKKEKVKQRKKKSKIASFIRAALKWFCFSPSNEPFSLSSSEGK
ncbi:uncharacterized protein LOC130222968 [Danio aesculapii]|uniref:uncharacterized protein LOC130222968 n=1 Tax=Danio aesculapii TaxID=1142201 RepID=UPI0024C0E1F5|nr:uncharacterized protein LOC130222968 [Danio aesculapii]